MKCILTGEVLEIIPRNFPSGDAYVQARVLCGKADVVSVNFIPSRFVGDMPREGESVDVSVSVRAFVSKAGAPGLGIDAESARLHEATSV